MNTATNFTFLLIALLASMSRAAVVSSEGNTHSRKGNFRHKRIIINTEYDISGVISEVISAETQLENPIYGSFFLEKLTEAIGSDQVTRLINTFPRTFRTTTRWTSSIIDPETKPVILSCSTELKKAMEAVLESIQPKALIDINVPTYSFKVAGRVTIYAVIPVQEFQLEEGGKIYSFITDSIYPVIERDSDRSSVTSREMRSFLSEATVSVEQKLKNPFDKFQDWIQKWLKYIREFIN